MEVVGGIASIVNLVQLAAAVVQITGTIIKRIHDAPEELQELYTHLQIIHMLLEQTSTLELQLHQSLVSSSLRSVLQFTLKSIESVLKKLDITYRKFRGATGVTHRCRLALFDSAAVQKKLNQLMLLEHHLAVLIQLACLTGQSKPLEKLEFLEELVKSYLEISKYLDKEGPLDPATLAPGPYGRTSVSDPGQTSQVQCQNLLLPRWMGPTFKWHCTLVKVNRMEWTDFSFYIRYGLPFLNYVFQMECCVRKAPLCRSVSLRNGGGIALSKVIPDDSDLMIACQRGDLFTVKELFALGKARPDDISQKKNMTPTLYAIQSGDRDLVKFLLDNGAGPNWAAGLRQTSPLQWAIQHHHLDIAKLLIERGADVQHISVLGWNPLYYCWPHMHSNSDESIAFINLLAEYSILDLETLDSKSWSALDRAAAFGTASDVQRLRKLGASPFAASPPLQWTPLHHAVHFGNWLTFAYLLPLYGDTAIRMADERGWTLLHIAAYNGRKEMCRRLLGKGCDPNARSKKFYSHMEEALFGQNLTPLEVADIRGPEISVEFRQALLDPEEIEDLENEDEDDFLDAQEYHSSMFLI